ncbi:hypothetical protein BZA05DRAFT_416163 [Tricharina praecox]|uniref:uncharacterized protein n=1 Tax=Tricharina praecox TaxID=43433 RepID=UPI00221F3451|nr:uncharacterized protein BZA05DRAFT_416163 [Tricharina praecox]KAI5856492.1 hypothetical protein BZA05DRAFT_416163 [Tricharina praecox]
MCERESFLIPVHASIATAASLVGLTVVLLRDRRDSENYRCPSGTTATLSLSEVLYWYWWLLSSPRMLAMVVAGAVSWRNCLQEEEEEELLAREGVAARGGAISERRK